MRKKFVGIIVPMCLLFSVALVGQDKSKAVVNPADTSKKSPKNGIADKIKSSRKIDGLFTLYQDTATGSIQIYVKKNQLGKEYIYQSFSMGGPTILFLNQNMIRATWVFAIKKQFDKLEFAEENTNFYYDPSNPVSKAANVDVPGSIFYVDKIAGEDDNGYLIGGDGLFLSEKLDQVRPNISPLAPPGAVFNLGNLNSSKSG